MLLALNVSRVRIRERIGNGDGRTLAMKEANRAHLNTGGHAVPFGLVALGMAIVDAPPSVVAALVAS